MKELDEYYEARGKVIEYFGYDGLVEDIEDHRDEHWAVDNYELLFGDDPSGWDEFGPDYSDEIHHYNCNPAVFRAKDYTMILVRTCFGDKRLYVFSNSKEIKK